MAKPMTITLTPDVEACLIEHARKSGIAPEQLAIASLREHFVSSHTLAVAAKRSVSKEARPNPGETLYDLIQDHIGVLHSSEYGGGSAEMSVDAHRKFAEGLLEEHQRSQRQE